MSDSIGASLWRRLPLWIVGMMTLLAVTQSHLAFGGGLGRSPTYFLTAVLVMGALVTVSLITGGLQELPRTLAKETVGSSILIVALFVIAVLADSRFFAAGLRSWQIIVAGVAAFLFVVQSHRSFLLMAGLDAFLMMVALLEHPRFDLALVFTVLFLALLAVLHYREKAEENPRESLPASGILVQGAPSLVLAGSALLVACHLLQPSESQRLAERMLEGDPLGARTLTTGGALDRAMPTDRQRDRFGRIPASAGGADPGAAVMNFQTDLKFGDHGGDGDGGHPFTVVMYVELRDEQGERIGDAGGMIPGWVAGAVSRYEGGQWIAGTSSGTLVRDRDDGIDDGWILLTAPYRRVATRVVEQRIILMPTAGRTLFAAYPMRALQLAEIFRDAEGIFSRMADHAGRFKFTAQAVLARPSLKELEGYRVDLSDRRYLDVPASFASDPVVTKIAGELERRASSPTERIDAVLALLSESRYTLKPGLAPNGDPTVEFLRLGRGYCQHFASAMALLLRMLEVPSRIVIGFSRGDWNAKEKIFVVRNKHAHAWVEVPFDGAGWVPFDPVGGALGELTSRIRPPARDPILAPSESAPEPSPSSPGPTASAAPVTGSPSPSRAVPAPSASPAPQGEEFGALWNAVDNKAGQPRFTQLPRATGSAAPEADAGSSSSGRGWGRTLATLFTRSWRIVRDVLLLAATVLVVALAILRAAKWRRRRREESRAGQALPGEQFLGGDTRREAPPRLHESVPRGSRRRRVVELYLDLVERLGERGLPREPWQTPQEYLASLSAKLAPSLPGMRALTGMFDAARYGDADIDPARVADAQRIHHESVALLKKSKR